MTRPFNSRSFTAFVVTAAFLVATITGIVLYVTPQGRVANWVDWTLAGLAKHDWTNVHILLGLVFIVSGILHLYYNWKPFKKYLTERAKDHVRISAELVAALMFSVICIAGAIAHLPPFN